MKKTKLITLLTTLTLGMSVLPSQITHAKKTSSKVLYVQSNTDSEVTDSTVNQRVASQDVTAQVQNSSDQVNIPKGTTMTLAGKANGKQLVKIPNDTRTLIVPMIDNIAYPYQEYTYTKADYAKLNRDGKKWAKGLSKTQVKAVGDYTSNGYKNDNQYLRTGKSKKIAKTKEEINNVKNSLAKFQLEKPMTVYRGVQAKGFKTGLKGQKLTIGSTYNDPAFQSTSIDKSIAMSFLDVGAKKGKISNNNVIMKINLPSGKTGAYIKSLSKVKSEKEYLLSPNQNLVVTRVQNVKVRYSIKDYKTTSNKIKKLHGVSSKFTYKLVTLDLVK